MIFLYFSVLFLLTIFSYGFIDPNLHLWSSPVFLTLVGPLKTLVFDMRPVSTLIFFVFLLMLSGGYVWFLKKGSVVVATRKKLFLFLVAVSVFLACSFPALTYDLFNYITTAKVTFFHHENPYLVMPVEIPNEPYLAFTRAANKVALYGPVWILLTAIPHYLGQGNIWLTIISFKLMNAIWYLGFSLLIYRVTKSIRNVLFFSLNPLVLIEVLVSGHNDMYMMTLVILGLLLWEKKGIGAKIAAGLLLIASWLVKGATLVLLPLFFVRNLSRDRILFIAYCLLSIVFFVFAPLREELYPWYAVWLVSIASLMDMKKHTFIIPFTIVLSCALELRHLPYMYMGQYGGAGPMLRTLVTVVPIIGFVLFSFLRRTINKKQ